MRLVEIRHAVEELLGFAARRSVTRQETTVCCIAQRAAAARVDTPILP